MITIRGLHGTDIVSPTNQLHQLSENRRRGLSQLNHNDITCVEISLILYCNYWSLAMNAHISESKHSHFQSLKHIINICFPLSCIICVCLFKEWKERFVLSDVHLMRERDPFWQNHNFINATFWRTKGFHKSSSIMSGNERVKERKKMEKEKAKYRKANLQWFLDFYPTGSYTYNERYFNWYLKFMKEEREKKEYSYWCQKDWKVIDRQWRKRDRMKAIDIQRRKRDIIDIIARQKRRNDRKTEEKERESMKTIEKETVGRETKWKQQREWKIHTHVASRRLRNVRKNVDQFIDTNIIGLRSFFPLTK